MRSTTTGDGEGDVLIDGESVLTGADVTRLKWRYRIEGAFVTVLTVGALWLL